MTIYKLHIGSRKGESDSKVFKTFQEALDYIAKVQFGGDLARAEAYKMFDSNFDAGVIFTEENSYEVSVEEL